MANRLVPGVQITEPDLARYYRFDPGSILTFSRNDKLLGAVAFLYLNSRGHDALMLDEICLTHPDIGLLAAASEEVSAIYVWAIAGQGRAMAGLGNVSEHLSRPRLAPRRSLRATLERGWTQPDDRDRLRTDPELSARTLALPAPLESHSDQCASISTGEEFCRCTALAYRLR